MGVRQDYWLNITFYIGFILNVYIYLYSCQFYFIKPGLKDIDISVGCYSAAGYAGLTNLWLGGPRVRLRRGWTQVRHKT